MLSFDSVKSETCLLIPSLQCWPPNETLVFVQQVSRGCRGKQKVGNASSRRGIRDGRWEDETTGKDQDSKVGTSGKGGWIQFLFFAVFLFQFLVKKVVLASNIKAFSE